MNPTFGSEMDDDVLRIQVTIRRSTKPELFKALTVTRAGRFASVRICQLALIGLGMEGRRRFDDHGEVARREPDGSRAQDEMDRTALLVPAALVSTLASGRKSPANTGGETDSLVGDLLDSVEQFA